MVLHMTRPWKHPRTGSYYFRKGVPEAIRSLVGKREIKISLGTKDVAEARRRHVEVAAEVEASLAQLRDVPAEMGPQGFTRLSHEDTYALAGELYRRVMSDHGSDPGDPKAWRGKLDSLQLALPDRQSRMATRRWPGWAFGAAQMARVKVGSTVQQLLDEKTLVLDFQTRAVLNVACATALAQAYRELIKRAEGDYRPDPDAERFPTPPNAGYGPTLTWQALYGEYTKVRKPAASTTKRQLGVLTAFFAFLGHDEPSRVTRADVKRWMAHRLTQPGISAKTVWYSDVAHPRSLLNWALGAELISNEPFLKIQAPTIRTVKTRAREFTLDEAERVLSATLVPSGPRMTVEGAAARRWIPWICAYTGARVNEVTQARAEDVYQTMSRDRSKVWVINITPEAGSVKTHQAREVALHPHLIEQGFLDYVKSRRGKHLFYAPERARGGKAANPQYKKVGERLARWVRKDVGITDLGIDPNHGWRHLFRSSMLAAGVQEQVIDRIDGHASRTVGQSYGTAWPEVMLAAVSKIPPYLINLSEHEPNRA